MGFKSSLLIAATSVLLATAPAFAATFTFEGAKPSSGIAAGKNKSITTTFNSNTEKFTWSSTFERNNAGKLADGAWLVINGGANPKSVDDELAIFYLDGINGKVSIYNYDGTNNSKSWNSPTANYLGSLDLNVSPFGNDEVTFSFELDATKLNSSAQFGSDWKGASFGKKVGIWYHGVEGLKVAYDPTTGALTQFKHGKSSSYDVGNMDAAAVPEPASAAAVGLFAVAATFIKRKKQSA